MTCDHTLTCPAHQPWVLRARKKRLDAISLHAARVWMAHFVVRLVTVHGVDPYTAMKVMR